MTVALTNVKVYPIENEDWARRHFLHAVEVTASAANTDTSVALGTLAAADAVNGPYLTTVLNKAERIILAAVDGLTRVGGGLNITKLDSAVSVGGNATETMTVTGLLTTDTILGVTQFVDGAGAAVGILAYGGATGVCSVADQLSVTWNADPGAGAKIRVAVERVAAAGPTIAGEYSYSQASLTDPTFTFPGLTLTPTTIKMFLLVMLKPGMTPVRSSNLGN